MTLYVVPTPLGNLEDITLRALKVLREVRAVYCEDTRRTRALLSHFDIHVPCVRYDERDPRGVDRFLERLAAGEPLALVSDGGTPVISDPGLRVVARAREAGHPVVALPGACAAASAVAGSGLPGDSFVFLGFLPRSESRRRRALEAAARLRKTVVLYEAPTRVAELLRAARDVLGPDARAAVARELTKVHEEWITGTLGEVERRMKTAETRGEFAIVLAPALGAGGKEHPLSPAGFCGAENAEKETGTSEPDAGDADGQAD